MQTPERSRYKNQYGNSAKQKNSETVIALDYYNKTEFDENFSPAVSDIKGSYPSGESEIMLSRAALDALDLKTGDRYGYSGNCRRK